MIHPHQDGEDVHQDEETVEPYQRAIPPKQAQGEPQDVAYEEQNEDGWPLGPPGCHRDGDCPGEDEAVGDIAQPVHG